MVRRFIKKYDQKAVLFCFIIFFLLGTVTALSEIKKSFALLKKMTGLSVQQKRTLLTGDVSTFAHLCNKIIPHDARVIFITNSPSNTVSSDLYINYFMFPRKLFLLNSRAPYPETMPRLQDLSAEQLRQRNISWIIYRYPEPDGINRIIKLDNGTAVACYDLAIEEKTYAKTIY